MVEVRAAQPTDFSLIAELTVAAYRADGQLDGEEGYEPVLRDVASRAASDGLLVAVDESSGTVLGTVTFVLHGNPYAQVCGPGEAEFRMLAVSPLAQRRGVGEALVRACVAKGRELGCSAVVISTRDIATAAHSLYGRLGFVRLPGRDWWPEPDVLLHVLKLDLGPVPSPT